MSKAPILPTVIDRTAENLAGPRFATFQADAAFLNGRPHGYVIEYLARYSPAVEAGMNRAMVPHCPHVTAVAATDRDSAIEWLRRRCAGFGIVEIQLLDISREVTATKEDKSECKNH